MTKMPVIAWDVDDVLNNLSGEWLKEYNLSCQTAFAYSGLTANPPHQIMDIPLDKYLKSLDEFRRYKLAGLKPVPESLQWFEAHGCKFQHLAITAVPIKFAELSAQWVTRHFGKWIRSFNFVPSPRPDDPQTPYESSKAQFLKKFASVDFFVDDNENNFKNIDKNKTKCLLFPRPWNRKRGTCVNSCLTQITGEI